MRKTIKKNYKDLVGIMLILPTKEVGMVTVNIRVATLEYQWLRLRDEQGRPCFIIRHPSVVMDLEDETIEGTEIRDTGVYVGNIQEGLFSLVNTYNNLKKRGNNG